MLPAIVIGVWIIAMVLILLLWDMLRVKNQLNLIEHDLRVIDNTLARLSKTFLRPTPRPSGPTTLEY